MDGMGVRRVWAVWLAALSAAVVVGLAPARALGAEETSERWYVLRMQGERAGWMVSRDTELDGGAVRGEQRMLMRLHRLGQPMEISMTIGFVEAGAGELLEMTREQKMGLRTDRWTYRFDGDSVTRVVESAGSVKTDELAMPAGEWLTPLEVEAFIEERLEAGAESFSYETLDVTSGLRVVTMTHRVIGPGKVEVMGKTVPGIEWEVQTSLIPGMTTREWVDREGEMVRSSIDMGGMSMEILGSERAFAMSDFDAPELMAGTMVRPRGKVIENPREARRAVFLVSMEGDRKPTLAEAGAQRVEWLQGGRARVVVDVDDPLEATSEERAREAYLASSATVDASDPGIRALVEEATAGLPGDASPEDRARAMESFVAGYITEKSLGVGFATASEVCETREGDCSEHAVLLVAMLRADGIPARGVSGLVYVDQFHGNRKVFGFHMWAQAMLEIDGVKRWVDLDAAVHPMDATHIAISTSTLSDADMVNSMVSVAGMLQGLRIEVEEVE